MRGAFLQLERAFDRAKLEVKRRLGLIDPVMILPYHGYANHEKLRISGRLLEREGALRKDYKNESLFQNLVAFYRRFESDEIPFQTIIARFQGEEWTTQTDDEGFFHFELEINKPIPSGKHWLEVELEAPPSAYYKDRLHARGEVQVVQENSRFGIISDVDDTIIKSFADNLFKKLRTLLSNTPDTRTPFPNVAEFYQALQKSKNEYNPLFFVSGSSWNLYDFLVEFCEIQNIPKGTFFLRYLGINQNLSIKKDTQVYKQQHLKTLFDFYPDLPFILIGDSGQKDPEIYYELAKEYAGHILAVYIRNVTSKEREQEVMKLAGEMDQLDIPMCLVNETRAAAEHAYRNGWIEEKI